MSQALPSLQCGHQGALRRPQDAGVLVQEGGHGPQLQVYCPIPSKAKLTEIREKISNTNLLIHLTYCPCGHVFL